MKRDLYQLLSKRDMGHLLDLSYAFVHCNEQNQLNAVTEELGNLFPVDTILYANGNIGAMYEDNPVHGIKVTDISAPVGYVDMYFANKFHKTDAAIWEYLSTLKPVNWSNIKCNNFSNYPDSVMASDFGMNDGWSHGVLDIATMNFYFFYFGSSNICREQRTEKIVEYIVPFVAEADKRINTFQSNPEFTLTPREKEVLHWIKEGKGSWEISVILNCSKRVIDFHVANMKRKLDVSNRPQLVATALNYKLIDF